MGNLVFQATLGGQVNLVGPNTASTFNLNVPAVAGTLVTTGDSGTVTNTMLATSAYTAPGTIGSGTANTGAFTTLSASSTVSGTGFSTYLASPPAIGGTAAAAGTFTTLTGSTSVTTPIVKSASSLTLQSNGTTTAVTIDTSQNVGIGVTPSAWASGDTALQVKAGSSSGGLWGRSNSLRVTANTYFDGTNYKYIASDFASIMQVSQSGVGGFYWLIAPSGTAGTNATFTQAMTLNANGALALQGGSTSASGVGITFPATQSASSDANTLDDYEEGTWSPTLIGSVSNPTVTYNVSNGGRYIKIGKMVYLSFYFRITTTTGGSGNAYIGNLPFTCQNSTQNIGAGGVAEWSASFPGNALRPMLSTEVVPNATALNILKSGPNLASQNLTIADFSSTDTYLLGGIVYESTT